LHYSSQTDISQFEIEQINRELLKAYVGFSQTGNKDSKIITGNWGCGVFNGDLYLKFIIQWIACSLVNRKLIYCPFGSK
jgi:poly(ADP-ribose) glycohydrolase